MTEASTSTKKFLTPKSTSVFSSSLAKNPMSSSPDRHEWAEEIPESPASLRLLLRGKFLEGNTTLESHTIPVGQTTTVHLLIKNGQPEPTTPDKPAVVKENNGCQCIII
ncbi:hypothetical protein BC829DRAFT_421276 [Chytridium lagenaria]|nr:hypothetical protein BC829DRAFT_448933 [Chytridium lagenaria]KAI8838362.1 hypothetical protein BC829DRAFT_421276 [Chytridium lagenaria]